MKWTPKSKKVKINGKEITKKYEELDGSEKKSYNCAGYTKAKLNNESPDTCNQVEHFREVDELTDEFLKDKDYKEYKDDKNCGCGEGKMNDCAVLYHQKGNKKAGFHYAAFDIKSKKWGGKLSSTKGIARFDKPKDYLEIFIKDESERKKTEMTFFCKGTGDCENEKEISDEDLHNNAKSCKENGKDKKTNDGNGCLFLIASLMGLLIIFLF